MIAAAVAAGDVAAIRELLAADPSLASGRDENGLSLILLALFHRRRAACEALLEADPEIGVLEAAALGRTDRLRELLAADPRALDARTPDGFDPIGLAAFLGGPDAVRVLLDHGADPALRTDDGLDAAALSERDGGGRVAELLRARGGSGRSSARAPARAPRSPAA